ncbi:putative ABC transporter [Xylaria sp. FL0043]|nr:putative ABC transporter [Xylaria sp. FL0043]
MISEPALVLIVISMTCDAVLLLSLALRSTRRGRISFKTASGVLLLAILTSYWTGLSRFNFRHINRLISLLVSGLATVGLSLRLFHEQQSYKPSIRVILCLSVSILCDAIYLALPPRTDIWSNTSYPVLLRCCVHSVFLILEFSARVFASDSANKCQSPEELHGVLGKVLFTWINPILLQGYRNTLVDQELPQLSPDIEPEATRKAILQAWSQRTKSETDRTLSLVLMRCFKAQFFAAVIPRLSLIAFRYAQPVLIKQSIRHVASYSSDAEAGHEYFLVAAAVIIYVGRAVSSSIYQRSINKLKMATRSALIALIHDKSMRSPSIAYDNGQAITLMNTDAESLDGLAEMAHETWAQVVEVLIGIILLANDVGWIWPLPLSLIYLCSHMSRYVAKHLRPRQEAWNRATQSRIAATSSMISSMKTVKMLGFQEKLTRRIQELREEELWTASKQRWIVVYNNASANALGIFSPAITLVLFALLSAARGHNLNAETAFSTITLLGLITHPANMVMTIVPRAVGAFTGLKRIQAFLLQPSLHDSRGTIASSTLNKASGDLTSGRLAEAHPAIRIRQLNIGNRQPILKDVNIEMAAGSFTVISGSTGSGKSTLMRTILGEVVPVHGLISLSTRRIAYCSQRPWLPNGTIREAICGATKDVDEAWYHEVTNSCCLRHDIDSFPRGDRTEIGSRGLNLSGGQRQRVALARALFQRCDMLLLDDTFSGLDGETEQSVFENLFGTTGLIRRLKTTVVLISNSSQYFQLADHIVVLGERGVIGQGSWRDIKAKAFSVAKFSPSNHIKDSTVLSASFDKLSAQVRAKDEIKFDLERHTGDPSLYGYYFSFIGLTDLAILITTTAIYDFFITVPPYWLRLWVEVGGRDSAFYIGGLLLISFMSWFSTSVMGWCLAIRLAPHSGSQLHRHLLRSVTSAPLSYFSQTENGSILNRFSQDIQIIDKQLPSALSTVLVQILKLLAQIAILCVAEKWLVIYLPVCAAVVYIVQKVYLRTSRQLRFLELQSQAGVFSSFLESIEGLETIRSFGWSKSVVQDNIFRVDKFQRAGYLLLCLQQWLNIVLDLLTAAVTISVVAIAVAFRGTVSGAQIGIALNLMLVVNTTLPKLVLSWTELETSMSSIARLKSLATSILPEGVEAESSEPAENWPCKGDVEFKDVTASYLSSSTALRDVNLSIPAGQKLVVCGRTGSGKSTLLLTLLRLLELNSGTIEVDGVDIKGVNIDLLRRRCFISASQEPLLLSNETLRFNLDSDTSVSDETVIDILTKAGLWQHFLADTSHLGEKRVTMHISRSDEHGILDRKISHFQELSVGQCQLFALCRALVKVASLRRFGVKPVILLDEVTSSLDSATESIMYRIINDEFTQKGHTVIIVAHRLGALQENTVIGRDAVALMEDGKLLEVIRDLRPETFQRIGQVE